MALTVKPLEKVRKSIPVQDVAKPPSSELVRVNLQVNKDTRLRWHTEAMKREISLTEMIQRAVESYVNEDELI